MKSVTTVESENDSITLKKGAKGYQWEIKAFGLSHDDILAKITSTDKKLRLEFGDLE